MNNEFFAALEVLEKEKGISREYMLERVVAALQSAYKRENGGACNIRIMVDPDKKEMRVYRQFDVVEEVEEPQNQMTLEQAKAKNKRAKLGTVIEIEVKPKELGRLSIQTAKQVIIQGIREAERGNIIREYESKKEEILTAVVQRIDDQTGNVQVETGTSYATLIKSEQIPGETFEVGEHIKVFVMEVRKESRGPIVTLSRSHPGFIKRLFELEIPEIQDGTVIIKGVIREAGSRTKVAVYSRDESVDAIGACVGNRGMRIANIINEVHKEKIDVIRYSEIPEEFIASALSPAVVKQVIVDGDHSCQVYVDRDQLSLAIGREGQNARLAARLTGYKIYIKTSEQ